MMSRRAQFSAVVLMLGWALAFGACSRAAEPESPDAASDWLAIVQRAHSRADEAIAAGQSDRARAALQTALDAVVPSSVRAEHARVVRQDLWFRVATIDAHTRPAEALLAADSGLLLGRADDIFCSNLLAVRGRALAALGRDTEAASSYHEALEIDERLLHAALGQGQAGGP
jgi:predicted negative regulator of RcsB-dependent stress response